MSLRCNQWSKLNKNQQNYCWPPHICHVWKLEQTTKNKLYKIRVEKKFRLLFHRGVNSDKIKVNSWNVGAFYGGLFLKRRKSRVTEQQGTYPLQWRHSERDGVSNHRILHCLVNCLFRRRSKKHQSFQGLSLILNIPRKNFLAVIICETDRSLPVFASGTHRCKVTFPLN